MPHNIIKPSRLSQLAALCILLLTSTVLAKALPQEPQPSEPQAQHQNQESPDKGTTATYAQQQQQQLLLQLLRDRFLRTVAHDSTLTGHGTAASPLGVAVPLVVSGDVDYIVGPPGTVPFGTPGVIVGFNTNQGRAAGVYGSAEFIGVRGFGSVIGVLGEGRPDTGVVGRGGLTGVLGSSSGGNAGEFDGNVRITGTLTKAGGSFKIDHPLDPERKYLSHSFVESPDMKNIYDGVAVLDAEGGAVVQLPDYFAALNKDFRYQLTAIGAPGPSLYIAEKVTGNRFKVAGGAPGMEVSWQVTGIRQDAWANAHRIQVEENKPEKERKHYLHPELFGESEEMSVQWAIHPELMKQMKEEAVKESAAPQPK